MEKRPKKLQPGARLSKSTPKMMHLSWQDKRLVNMLTTLHNDNVVQTTKTNYKTGEIREIPECVRDYNQNMGAVDRSDLMLSYVECARKTMKWYRKLFFHLVDLTVLNSYYAWQVVTGEKKSLPQFQLQLCRQLIQKYGTICDSTTAGRRSSQEDPVRLVGQHFPTKLLPTPKNPNPTRKCKQCSKSGGKRKESRYECSSCKVTLCIEPCFTTFHS
jgi:hypothetical protein